MDRTMMDRTMMDRTVMDNYRADEKELSDKVHNKIETLTLINAPNEEFKKIFVKDMFLKPNPKAFFPVMHYLFITLDPVEFKKRFYWPILDKRSETIFRSSTVDYLNYLNNKHHLQWTQLKNYLVLMPGGYKFLTFLNDFLDFLAGVLVKQREKYLSEKMQLKDLNLNKINFNRLVQQRKCLRRNALQYYESVEDHTKTLKGKIDVLHNTFVKISKIIEIPFTDIDREFIKNFLEFGKDFLKEKITKKVDEFVSSEKNILAIIEDIKVYQIQKSEITYDRNKLLSSFNYIKTQNPKLMGNILCGNDLNFEILVKLFEYILPEIQKLFSCLDLNLLDQLKFEQNQLSKMNYEIMELDNDITKYSTSLNDDLRSNQTENNKTTPIRFPLINKKDLHSKFINTPPIPQCRNILDRGVKKRLCLMDDYYSKNISTMHDSTTNSGEFFSFANNQTTLMQMKTPKRDLKTRNNSTVNRSKIMDPSTLLRSLTKSKRSHGIGAITNQSNANLSTLAMKWKEHESSFLTGNENSILETSECEELTFDFNKTIDSEMIATVRKKPIPDSKKKLYLESPQMFLTSTNSPKNLVVQQVQNTSLDFSKISTSPSGRLESLIKLNQNELPKILLNDLSINLNNSVNIIEDLAIRKFGIEENNVKETDVENDINISNFDLNLNLSNIKDSIFNVSDTILKDISI